MTGYIMQRLLLLVVVVWGVASLTFVVTMVTGDPITLMMHVEATREQVDEMRHLYGLDRPFHEQYVNYMLKAARGDFGISFWHRQRALPLVLERMPNTIQLAFAAVCISVVFAFPIGTIAAIKRGSIYDGLVMVLALLGQAMPSFWLGLLLLLLFGVFLKWLPIGGTGGLKHLILPATSIAAYPLARNARLIRSSLLEVLGKEYITTARAKGLGEFVVLYRHALRNALIPMVTLVALDMGSLLGGALVVETIFSWPGVGRLIVDAIRHIDFPLIQAGTVMVALLFVTINLVVDVLYIFLDPRIRYTQ